MRRGQLWRKMGQLKSTGSVWPAGISVRGPFGFSSASPSSEIKVFLSCGHRRLPQLTCVETDAGNWSSFCWHRWWQRELGSGERRQGGDILGGCLVLARWQLPASKCSGSFSYKEQKTLPQTGLHNKYTRMDGRLAGGEPQEWQCHVTKDPLCFCHASSPWSPCLPLGLPKAGPHPDTHPRCLHTAHL